MSRRPEPESESEPEPEPEPEPATWPCIEMENARV